MAMEKQIKLISLLLDKTKKGQLDWSESIQRNSFQVSFRSNSVAIRPTPNEASEDETDYVFSLLNDEGKVVDTFKDVDVGNEIEPQSARASFYRSVSELYELARRTALGSEKVLNDIISELDDDIPF